jgi:hypothetical protein
MASVKEIEYAATPEVGASRNAACLPVGVGSF